MLNAVSYELPVFLVGQGLGATLAIEFLQKSKMECAGLILSSPWFHLRRQANLITNALTTLGSITSNVKITHELIVKV